MELILDTYDNIIDKEVCNFLSNSYLFVEKNNNPSRIIDRSSPENDIEKLLCIVAEVIKAPKDKKYIEVWTQNNSILDPHCDFNYLHNSINLDLTNIPESQFLSPITVALYTEVNDLIGGNLVLTGRSWRDEMPNPIGKKVEYMEPYIFAKLKPVEGTAVVFEGSEYYHWIEKIESGSRKSILMNFWDYPLYSS